MSLRRLDEIELVIPPDGAVSVALARHLTALWPDPDLRVLHERRAELVHGLLKQLKTEAIDLGGTDSPHPSEIVEIVVPVAVSLIGAASVIIAAWIQRPERKTADNKGVLGIKMRRSDGKQLEITYQDELSPDEMATMIDAFVSGSNKSGKEK
jgi:hypothetical protein